MSALYMNNKPTGIKLFDDLLIGETFIGKPKPIASEEKMGRIAFELKEARKEESK